MEVSSLNLPLQYRELKPALDAAFERIFQTGHYIFGKDIELFEKEVASYLNVPYAFGVSSGTTALWLGLKALGVGPGDLVVTTPFTFFATVSAIMNTGARPLFVDIDPNTLNIDSREVELALTGKDAHRIKAVVPVHMYGNPSDMTALLSITKKANIPVLEDAAQAIGSDHAGKRVGGLGDVGTFSFFPTKNLGALGDAGLIVTARADLAETIKKLRVHGQSKRYYHDIIGDNCRMDTLQAAYLRVFLPHLDLWLERRREIAKFYDRRIAELAKTYSVPKVAAGDRHTYHQYTLKVERGSRDALKLFLESKGVPTMVYYPVPCHQQQALASFGCGEQKLPHAEKAAREVLSIPIHPCLTNEEADHVASCLLQWSETLGA